MGTLLTGLPAGHTFPAMTFSVPPERARAYRDAAGDTLPLYDADGVVPPLAVAAFALGALLEQVDLPPGSLHYNEALQFRAPVPAGATLQCRATLSQRSTRAGWIVSVVDSDILLDGQTVVTSRAGLLSPAGPA